MKRVPEKDLPPNVFSLIVGTWRSSWSVDLRTFPAHIVQSDLESRWVLSRTLSQCRDLKRDDTRCSVLNLL